MDGLVAEVAHRVVVEAVVLGGLGVVADEVGGLLDLAERLDPVLADLDRHQRGVLHQPVADELRGAAQDREPILPASVAAQAGLGGPGGLHRIVDVGDGPGRERPEQEVCESIGERTSNAPSPSRQAPAM